MKNQEYPSPQEIISSLPEGRLPYIQLAHNLGEIASTYDLLNKQANIGNAIRAIAEADRNGTPEPPLNTKLSNLLQRADSLALVTRRERTIEDSLRMGNPDIITRDSSRVGLLLLYAIADFGNSHPLESENH